MAFLLVDEIRLTRDASRYGYAVGKLKVLETKRLDRAAFERILDARTFAEQKRLLSDSPYGRFLEHAQTAEDVETGLSEALESFYGFLDVAALPEDVTRFFRLRYDFANLKAVAKARFLGASAEGLLVEHGTLPNSMFEGNLVKLPEPFGSVAMGLPQAENDESDERSQAQDPALLLDISVDKAMFVQLVAAAKGSRSAFLLELARLAIDLANVKTLVRAKRVQMAPEAIGEMLVEGGSVPLSTLAPVAGAGVGELSSALQKIPALRSLAGVAEDPTLLDPALDAVTAAALKRGRQGQIGPEPVISYVFERESEVAILRVLLLGKLAGLSDETMRRRVQAIA